MPNKTVHPIHFDNFDGHTFERLVFAFLRQTNDYNWDSLEWYGQSGGDQGRDIWGVLKSSDEFPNGEKICVQCANHKKLEAKKIESDFHKILKAPSGIPDKLMIIAGGNVSAKCRDRVKNLESTSQIKKLSYGLASSSRSDLELNVSIF